MRTVLYVIWFLIPAFFLIMALWSFLEKLGNKEKRERPEDHLKQAFFVFGCVGVTVLIDQFMLEPLVLGVLGGMLPIEFFEVILLPFVLLVGAKIVGPTKPVMITKAPHPTDSRLRRKKN